MKRKTRATPAGVARNRSGMTRANRKFEIEMCRQLIPDHWSICRTTGKRSKSNRALHEHRKWLHSVRSHHYLSMDFEGK